MAADGAATLGNMGRPTAQQPTKKLYKLKERIVMGVSGPVGLGQLLKGKMETLWDDKALSGKKPHEAMAVISKGFRDYIVPELIVAQEAIKTIGNAGLSSAISSTLVAVPVNKELCVFQFDQQGAPEQMTDELPFASIGSGQSIADPFLGLLRRVFWSDHQPTVNEGLFAAIWALDHAIKVNPGGVAEPMQVMKMIQDGDTIEIKELSTEELAEHKEAVRNAERIMAESLSDFKKSVSGEEGTSEIPEPSQATITKK
jgi:20S proteasome alpha/beta subunit